MQNKTFESILLIVAMTLCACQHRHQPSEYIQTADSLLWSNPDSCLRYIEDRTCELSEYDQNCEELIWQHALYKTTDDPVNDSVLEALNEYFDSVKDWEKAGETEYIRGSYYAQMGDNFESTLHLKRAEHYFEDYPTKPILKGILYYYMTIVSFRSRIYTVAQEYCEKAVEYFKLSNNPHYIASAYYYLGKCNGDSSLVYWDSAMVYAKAAQNKTLCKEINISKSFYQDPNEAYTQNEILSDLKYLCDSCHIYIYAGRIVDIYLQRNDIENAEFYLTKLSKDTCRDVWSREKYYTFGAEILQKKGNTEDAYNQLKELHNQQTSDIEMSMYTDTYIVSQKYEAAKEQLWRQEEQEKKERAYMWLAICALLCLLAGSSAGYLLLRHKKTQLQLQLNEERSQRLEQEVETQQKVLQAKLRERVEVVKQLHQWSSKHDIKLPKSIDLLSPQRAARDQDNWKKFYEEYNLCYADKLNRMKEQNPELTESDLQCLALEDLGFDTSEMAFILGLTKRTVWNRRNLAKQHLGEIMIEN